MTSYFKKNILYIAWFVTLVAIIGSLYFSEVKHIAPCKLCWYQRIFMYPLGIILPIGMLRKDPSLPYYVLPLSLVGALVALYHTLLQNNLIPQKLITICNLEAACSVKEWELFHVITLPFVSFLTFSFLAALMIYAIKNPSPKGDT